MLLNCTIFAYNLLLATWRFVHSELCMFCQWLLLGCCYWILCAAIASCQVSNNNDITCNAGGVQSGVL